MLFTQLKVHQKWKKNQMKHKRFMTSLPSLRTLRAYVKSGEGGASPSLRKLLGCGVHRR